MPILFHRKDLIATTFLCCCYSPGVSLLRRLQFLLTFTPCVCSQFCGFGVLDSLAYSANGHPLTVVLPYHAAFNDCCSRTRLGISPSALTQRISPCDFYGIGFQDGSLKSVHDFRAFSRFSFPVCAYAHSSRCAPCGVRRFACACVPCGVPCGLWRHRRGGISTAAACVLRSFGMGIRRRRVSRRRPVPVERHKIRKAHTKGAAAFCVRPVACGGVLCVSPVACGIGGGIIGGGLCAAFLCGLCAAFHIRNGGGISEERRRPVCLCACSVLRPVLRSVSERRRRSFVSS